MKVKLQRHSFIDNLNWILVYEGIPIGTEYEVLEFHKDITIKNTITGEERLVNCYFVNGNGDEGFLPTDVFEILH